MTPLFLLTESWSLTTTENQCLGKPVFFSFSLFSPLVIIQFSSYKAEVNSLPDCIWVFRELLPYWFQKIALSKTAGALYSKSLIPSHQS